MHLRLASFKKLILNSKYLCRFGATSADVRADAPARHSLLLPPCMGYAVTGRGVCNDCAFKCCFLRSEWREYSREYARGALSLCATWIGTVQFICQHQSISKKICKQIEVKLDYSDPVKLKSLLKSSKSHGPIEGLL